MENAPVTSGVQGTDVVVYDLDGVVTRKDSFTALLTKRLRTSPARLWQAIPALLKWVASRDPEARALAARRIAIIGLAGMGSKDYSELAHQFGNQIGADPSWIRAEVVERMRQQSNSGSRIVIATATEARLAQALLRRSGAPFDLLSASQLGETPTGLSVIDHRVGKRKAQALREAGVDLAEAEFVTDSATDLPCARLARHVTLVGASARTRVRFNREGVTFKTFDA